MPTPTDTMSQLHRPHVSFILATHNRRDVVVDTLSAISRCGLDRNNFEIIAVDNASTDGTPEVIESEVDLLIRRNNNGGSCAKAHGLSHARGPLIVFLDDDSFPRPGSIERMIEHFRANPALGAAGFTVHLPSGRLEGAAMPDVFVGCGVGFRLEALRASGGLDRTFFMQAEEYDLTFRLVHAGWDVRVFDDLHVDHVKTETSRQSERITMFNVRNNLRVAARYLPDEALGIYEDDLTQRYRWLAENDGHLSAFDQGVTRGRRRAIWERIRYEDRRLSGEHFEMFFRWQYIEARMRDLAEQGITQIVLAGLGKNIYPFYRGADLAGISVKAIADDRFATPGRAYRGVSVLTIPNALRAAPQAVIVSDTSPVHAAYTRSMLKTVTSIPVHDWFGRQSVLETDTMNEALLCETRCSNSGFH